MRREWIGPILIEDKPTDDRRIITAGGVTLPAPGESGFIMPKAGGADVIDGGPIGQIQKLWRIDNQVMGFGWIEGYDEGDQVSVAADVIVSDAVPADPIIIYGALMGIRVTEHPAWPETIIRVGRPW